MILIFPIVLLVLWQGLIGFLMVFEMFAKSDWSAVDRVLGIQWISMALIIVVALASMFGGVIEDWRSGRERARKIVKNAGKVHMVGDVEYRYGKHGWSPASTVTQEELETAPNKELSPLSAFLLLLVGLGTIALIAYWHHFR